jgi:hypothetical protein
VWYLDGKETTEKGDTFTFASGIKGNYIISLVVENGGKIYNTNIIIEVSS